MFGVAVELPYILVTVLQYTSINLLYIYNAQLIYCMPAWRPSQFDKILFCTLLNVYNLVWKFIKNYARRSEHLRRTNDLNPIPKVTSLCDQNWSRPACTSMKSDQALYCWPTNFKFTSWFPKILDSSKNGRWTSPFKKLTRLRVHYYNSCVNYVKYKYF